MSATLTIGKVAARVGIATSAIRYYERVGLLPEAERVSGSRRYGEDGVRRLRMIRTAQEAGCSLDDIRVLLRTEDAGHSAHEEVRALAARKLPEIDALIERAQQTRAWLERAQSCTCDTLDGCGLFAIAPPR